MLLPTLTGVWVGKKAGNSWKAIALGTGIISLGLIPVLSISESTPIMLLYISFAATGIAESFRSVSVTPAAQKLLEPEQLATGTALLNFVNTLATVFAAAMGGSLLGAAKGDNILGIKLIFGSAIIIAAIGFLLTVFYIRPKQLKKISKVNLENSELSK